MNCKYCGSNNLVLEPKIEGQDVITADMVALKCGDCGKWLKWCPKAERVQYIIKSKTNAKVETHFEDKDNIIKSLQKQ